MSAGGAGGIWMGKKQPPPLTNPSSGIFTLSILRPQSCLFACYCRPPTIGTSAFCNSNMKLVNSATHDLHVCAVLHTPSGLALPYVSSSLPNYSLRPAGSPSRIAASVMTFSGRKERWTSRRHARHGWPIERRAVGVAHSPRGNTNCATHIPRQD